MTTDTRTDIPIRLDFAAHATAFSRAMNHIDTAATQALDRAAIDHRLRESLRLRFSQLSGCAYCVDMRSQTARAVGETVQRLAAPPVWRETPCFTGAERSALSFA